MPRSQPKPETKYNAIVKLTLELSVPLETQKGIREAVEEALTDLKSIDGVLTLNEGTEQWDSDVEVIQVYKVGR